jgi:hypothetical protein
MTREQLISQLESLEPEQKYWLVQEFVYALQLFARGFAFAPEEESKQLDQLKGTIEIFHRCFEQMRSYTAGFVGRPDRDFIEVVLKLAGDFHLSGEVVGAFAKACKNTVIQPN